LIFYPESEIQHPMVGRLQTELPTHLFGRQRRPHKRILDAEIGPLWVMRQFEDQPSTGVLSSFCRSPPGMPLRQRRQRQWRWRAAKIGGA